MLARIGGFEQFADSLADDYAVGEAVRATGAEVTARQLWSHELRWARTVRSIDPAGYLGTIFAHPFALALLATLAGGGRAAATVAVLALLCRITLLTRLRRRDRGARRDRPTDIQRSPVRQARADLHRLRCPFRRMRGREGRPAKRAQGAA
jgi:Glycosyl transferase family 21